jgi:hypothetical protein
MLDSGIGGMQPDSFDLLTVAMPLGNEPGRFARLKIVLEP